MTSRTQPVGDVTATSAGSQNQQCAVLTVECELRSLAKINADLSQYLLAFLLRCGYMHPPDSLICGLAARTVHVAWLDDYLRCRPFPLGNFLSGLLDQHYVETVEATFYTDSTNCNFHHVSTT
jgi:hypothetical protein